MVLRDLERLCERYVPPLSLHPAYGREGWWPAHEIGHLLTVPPEQIGMPMFGLGHEIDAIILEGAAMDIGRRLLIAVGHFDLIREEVDSTDTVALHIINCNRAAIRKILRQRNCLRIPRTRASLERKLAKLTHDVRLLSNA